MRENLSKGVNLQTRTKATKITETPEPDPTPKSFKWIVQTPRAPIKTNQVIHATNAYSSALEPSLRGLIYPSPHMCNRIKPPVEFEDPNPAGLTNSYGVLLPEGGLFSINPRSTREGSVLFGGSNPGQAAFERWVNEPGYPERGVDDGIEVFGAVTGAVKDFAEGAIEGWKAEFAVDGWSGIIGRVSFFSSLFYYTVLVDYC
jgi:glycine/D-amino acid oxidase-like deaminating enzyme